MRSEAGHTRGEDGPARDEEGPMREWILAEANYGFVKDDPYECGMLPVGEGAPRFSVKFYMVAMLFVIFDIEVVFMYPWAVQFKELIAYNAMALLSMTAFVAILGVAYLYVLKKGALSWKG